MGYFAIAVSIPPKADNGSCKASADLVGFSMLLNDTGRKSEDSKVLSKAYN